MVAAIEGITSSHLVEPIFIFSHMNDTLGFDYHIVGSLLVYSFASLQIISHVIPAMRWQAAFRRHFA